MDILHEFLQKNWTRQLSRLLKELQAEFVANGGISWSCVSARVNISDDVSRYHYLAPPTDTPHPPVTVDNPLSETLLGPKETNIAGRYTAVGIC